MALPPLLASPIVSLLFIICYLLFTICYMLFVIYYLLFVICYLVYVAGIFYSFFVIVIHHCHYITGAMHGVSCSLYVNINNHCHYNPTENILYLGPHRDTPKGHSCKSPSLYSHHYIPIPCPYIPIHACISLYSHPYNPHPMKSLSL